MEAPSPVTVSDIRALEAVAVGHLRAREVPAGIAAFEALIAARPGSADDWFNLAYLQRWDRQFEAALHSYATALQLGISGPEEVLVNRAAILSEHLNRADDAVEELQQALALNPHFLQAWLNLGALHEDEGRSAQARSAYMSALEIAPTCGHAHARLAAIDMFEGGAAAANVRINQALPDGRASPEDLAELRFAQALTLDAMGRYDEAFSSFHEANRRARRLIPPQLAYSRHRQDALVEQIMTVFDRPVASATGGAEDRVRPLFICGLFRSGSTLAEQLLGRHSRVTVGGELEIIPAMVERDLQPYPTSLLAADPDRIAALRGEYVRELAQIHPVGGLITDKRSDNFLHIGLIKSLFPEAKIIHTTRDILDNILSIYCLYFGDAISYGFDLGDIVHYAQSYRRLMDHWRRLYPDDIIELDYDRLVRAPQDVLGPLLARCGLDWEAACLTSAASAQTVRTASSWQVRKPLHAKSSGRWRNYARHLEEVRAALN